MPNDRVLTENSFRSLNYVILRGKLLKEGKLLIRAHSNIDTGIAETLVPKVHEMPAVRHIVVESAITAVRILCILCYALLFMTVEVFLVVVSEMCIRDR